MFKNRVFLTVLSCALILISILSFPLRMNPHELYVLVCGFPGALLGIYLFFTRTKQTYSSFNSADELLKWKKLLDSGAISEYEFEKKKSDILK